MRIIFLITLSFIINIYAQFTSGTDYSVQTSEETSFTEIGAEFYTGRSEAEWERSSVSGDINESMKASSDVTEVGYGMFCKYPLGKSDLFFYGNRNHKEINVSASIKKNDSLDVISIPSFSYNEIRARSGIDFKERYAAYVQFYHLYTDKRKTAFQLGGGGEYSHVFESGSSLAFAAEYNVSENKEALKELMFHSALLPESSFGISYGIFPSGSRLRGSFRYLNYTKNLAGEKPGGYINLEAMYGKELVAAKTKINACAGINLSEEFSAPEIFLPYLYYSVTIGADFLENRINLSIGWDYALYHSILSDRREMTASVLNEEFDLANDKTDFSSYRLNIRLSMRF